MWACAYGTQRQFLADRFVAQGHAPALTRNGEALLMNYERTEQSTTEQSTQMQPGGGQAPDDGGDREPNGNNGSSEVHGSDTPAEATVVVRGDALRGQEPATSGDNSSSKSATVVVHGETASNQETKSTPKNSSGSGKEKSSDKEKSSRKKVSEAKAKIQARLPALEDDADVGVQKSQVVTRDGKPDLAFTGTLLASAASPSSPQGKWQEYRVYETSGGKHVFSKANRSVFAEEQDGHEAEIFDPAPSSVPSQVLRSARDLIHTRPLIWQDAAADFFGYDPLAKTLYRKLSGQFEEHIS
jgi:hypothetical protein